VTASSDGQRGSGHPGSALRSRESSGTRIGRVSPLLIAERLDELHCLVAGMGVAWVWGPTAGAVLEFDEFVLAPPYHFVVPRGRSVQRVGHVIHSTTFMPLLDTAVVRGIPVTSATRTIIDLASFETDARLTLAVDSATRDGTTSDDFLYREIVAHRTRGRRGIGRLLAVMEGIELTKGGHSWLEREFLILAAAAGLPRPATQQIVGQRKRKIIRVDCHFPGTRVVVELLGYTFHRTVMQMQNDAARMNRMVLDGLIPMQFTFTDVVDDAASMMDLITEALER
jgi:hypothetical protein